MELGIPSSTANPRKRAGSNRESDGGQPNVTTARANKVHAIAPCQQQVRHGQGGNDMPCTAAAGHRYGFGLVHGDSRGSIAALILMIFKTVVCGLPSQVSNPEQILTAALLTGAYAARSPHRGALNPPATDQAPWARDAANTPPRFRSYDSPAARPEFAAPEFFPCRSAAKADGGPWRATAN